MDGTPCEILQNRHVCSRTVALALSAPKQFDAKPGQFLQVRRPGDDAVTRHYSISAPFPDSRLELTVGVDPDGALSPWLASRTAGDTVEIAGPFGRVYYEGESAVLAVGCGPGIGAALAIAERTVAEGGRATLIVARPSAGGDIVHEDRLATLATVADVRLTADESVATVVESRLVESREGGQEDPQVFAFGFGAFVERVRRGLTAAGVDPHEAKLENFG